ncbi:helix-turn-helix domain-containing protein [Nocardia huaxiensis]|uniref:Helix-turn-helix domain-containing protein n=1 Tax=Nocardia huaxiensis TaxID=2755382 RepID=A0A7D6V7Z1_9NOCA|nr:helix-turn-helix transcriptional regulator [Nocardia huaxiensis]QLY29872.1 helix-turn-helix domain-containing protein [Nocardia huaxiensis]UFS96540.1 helix-turn-helix domain-containing protein [Nocardia huaxiensis]
MTNNVYDAQEALGARLRELRRRSGLTGRALAGAAGWHESKVSKIEYGRITPTDADIRAYCEHTGAADQLADLLATLHTIDAAYVEWRRILGTGLQRRQQKALRLEAEATVIRDYQPQIIPGLLQTAEYAEAKLRRGMEFHQAPDDLDAAVSKRMERQRILYQRDHRFHFLIAEQALYTTVGSDVVMRGQLDRLAAIIGMPRVALGIVPATAEALVVSTNFAMFDNRLVMVEGTAAELTITQPREIATYGRAFKTLAGQSVSGEIARNLIRAALERRR